MKHAVGQQRIGISWLDSKDSVYECDYTSKSLLRVCLVGVKTGKMENTILMSTRLTNVTNKPPLKNTCTERKIL